MKNHYQTISPITSIGKRIFDIVTATILLIATLPLFPIIAVAIKLDSPGSVFYKQLRIGRAQPDRVELFYIIKFRSMRNDAEKESGAQWATKKDSRVTAVGSFLRKTRLDEIPQLFNVLRGEMSIVGPRPERPCFYQKLENAIPFFTERTFFVTPGITGLAQVNQGYDVSIDDVRSKVGYDHSYALALHNPISWIKMDLQIAFRTFIIMITGRGQ